MSRDFLKYISEEKDIAKYRLSLLEKGARKQYKDRLASTEREFIEDPFEKLLLSSVEDYRDAMDLFKSDRPSFYAKYEKEKGAIKRVVTTSQINLLKNKISHFNDLYKTISV